MLNSRHSIRTALAVATGLGILCGCHPGPHRLRVGLVVASKGEAASGAEHALDAAHSFAREMNARGGVEVEGQLYPVEIATFDADSKSETAANPIDGFVRDNELAALVGLDYNGELNSVAAFAEQDQIPMVEVEFCDKAFGQNSARNYVFQIPLTEREEAGVVSNFAFNRLRFQRAAVLFNGASESERTAAQQFIRLFKERGGEVLGSEDLAAKGVTSEAALSRIANLRPEFVFAPLSVPELVRMARPAKELGLSSRFIGGFGWEGYGALLAPGVAGAYNDCYFVQRFFAGRDINETVRFVETYRARYGSEPAADAAFINDALTLVVAAATQSSSDSPKAIHKALSTIPETRGSAGKIHLDDAGMIRPELPVLQLQPTGAIWVMSGTP